MVATSNHGGLTLAGDSTSQRQFEMHPCGISLFVKLTFTTRYPKPLQQFLFAEWPFTIHQKRCLYTMNCCLLTVALMASLNEIFLHNIYKK